MKEGHQVRQQLAGAYKELEAYSKADYGAGGWRRTRGYIDALEWVLEYGGSTK
jgi:hypothetical protein